MIRQLITSPMRIGVRATRMLLSPAEAGLERLVAVTGSTVNALTRQGSATDARPEARSPAKPPARPAPRTARQTPDAGLSGRNGHAEPSIPVGPKPADLDLPESAHVSQERVLAAEVAEPGAQDGAGAQLRVGEPWNGYHRMRAAEIVDQLTGATPEVLALVKLYEGANRRRETVLSAADRELRSATRRAGRPKPS